MTQRLFEGRIRPIPRFLKCFLTFFRFSRTLTVWYRFCFIRKRVRVTDSPRGIVRLCYGQFPWDCAFASLCLVLFACGIRVTGCPRGIARLCYGQSPWDCAFVLRAVPVGLRVCVTCSNRVIARLRRLPQRLV